MFIADSKRLIFIPESAQFTLLSNSISQKLEQAGITEDELQAGLADVREEIAREHYPELFSELAVEDVH